MANEIVPLKITEHVILTSKQQSELLESARKYLTTKKVVPSREVLTKTMSVLKDAVDRSFASAQKTHITPSDKLTPHIRAGLKIRQKLIDNSRDIIYQTSHYRNYDSLYLGPLAFPAVIYNNAYIEIQDADFSPSLGNIEQILLLQSTRIPLLEQWSRLCLRHLPSEFSDVTIDKIPDLADRAKLIRNSIVSFLYRDNLSPFFTTEDLYDIWIRSKTSDKFGNLQLKESLLSTFEAVEKPSLEFFEGLIDQSRSAFEGISRVSSPETFDETREMDKFFNLSRQTFLLLHPALEEQRIVTSPALVTEKQPSLWDDAVVIEGLKIPTIESLNKALRQTTQRGHLETAQRIKEALKLWKEYKEGNPVHKSLIIQKENELEARRAILYAAKRDNIPLPEEAYRSDRYKSEDTHKKALTLSRHEREETKSQSIVEDSEEQLKDALEYEKFLEATYGDFSVSTLVPMSRKFFTDTFLNQAEELENEIKKNTEKLKIAFELIKMDFFFIRNMDFSTLDKQISQIFNVGFLANQIRYWESNYRKMQRGTYFEEISLSDIVRLREGIKRSFFKHDNFRRVPKELKKTRDFWSFLPPKLEYKEHSPEFFKYVTPEIYQEILKHRISILKFLQKVTYEVNDMDRRRMNLIFERESYYSNSAKRLPATAIWTKREAIQYIKEIKASTITDLNGYDFRSLEIAIGDMSAFLIKAPNSCFPPHIQGTRKDLTRWINEEIAKIDERLEHKKEHPGKKGETFRNLENRKTALNKLLRFVYHPLFPLPEGAHLPKDSFNRAWFRRLKVANALINLSMADIKSAEARVLYDQIVRSTYIRWLEWEVEAKETDLIKLKNRNLEAEFAAKMERLNLVLKNSPSSLAEQGSSEQKQ